MELGAGRAGMGWSWAQQHHDFGPAVSNIPLSTSQHGKTAFARDHPLGDTGTFVHGAAGSLAAVPGWPRGTARPRTPGQRRIWGR